MHDADTAFNIYKGSSGWLLASAPSYSMQGRQAYIHTCNGCNGTFPSAEDFHSLVESSALSFVQFVFKLLHSLLCSDMNCTLHRSGLVESSTVPIGRTAVHPVDEGFSDDDQQKDSILTAPFFSSFQNTDACWCSTRDFFQRLLLHYQLCDVLQEATQLKYHVKCCKASTLDALTPMSRYNPKSWKILSWHLDEAWEYWHEFDFLWFHDLMEQGPKLFAGLSKDVSINMVGICWKLSFCFW